MIETTSSGIVSAPATHSRRVKSTSSGLGVSSSDGSSGSSAMPQIGQVPGPSWRICGCIGHVHIAPGVAIGRPGFGGGFLAGLARPLPLDYAGVGTAAALLGYWVRRKSLHERQVMEAGHAGA